MFLRSYTQWSGLAQPCIYSKSTPGKVRVAWGAGVQTWLAECKANTLFAVLCLQFQGFLRNTQRFSKLTDFVLRDHSQGAWDTIFGTGDQTANSQIHDKCLNPGTISLIQKMCCKHHPFLLILFFGRRGAIPRCSKALLLSLCSLITPSWLARLQILPGIKLWVSCLQDKHLKPCVISPTHNCFSLVR